MNYARFREPAAERDLTGLQTRLEFDTVEIEDGHELSINASGDFEWDGLGWSCDYLLLHTYSHGPEYEREFHGSKFKTRDIIEKTLRVDDRADFKWLVAACEAWANKNHQPEDYL